MVMDDAERVTYCMHPKPGTIRLPLAGKPTPCKVGSIRGGCISTKASVCTAGAWLNHEVPPYSAGLTTATVGAANFVKHRLF